MVGFGSKGLRQYFRKCIPSVQTNNLRKNSFEEKLYIDVYYFQIWSRKDGFLAFEILRGRQNCFVHVQRNKIGWIFFWVFGIILKSVWVWLKFVRFISDELLKAFRNYILCDQGTFWNNNFLKKSTKLYPFGLRTVYFWTSIRILSHFQPKRYGSVAETAFYVSKVTLRWKMFWNHKNKFETFSSSSKKIWYLTQNILLGLSKLYCLSPNKSFRKTYVGTVQKI